MCFYFAIPERIRKINKGMSSSCPFCYVDLPYSELEWHVNAHLEEGELARDIEVAQQIALSPSSPISMDLLLDSASPSEALEFRREQSYCSSMNSEMRSLQDKISLLAGSQVKSPFVKVEGGLMCLVRKCLEMESNNCISILAGYIDHFQTSSTEDSGWGCGWRNIQMLSSHLLAERQESREVLFGGLGFVPDIPSLQRWLEIAWERGFDKPGSDSFNHKIYGSKKWIGTTECAALIRSFGLLARVVDFDGRSKESCDLPIKDSVTVTQAEHRSPKGRNRKVKVYGPMDKLLDRKHRNNLEFCSVMGNGSECIKDSLTQVQLEEDIIVLDDNNSDYSEKLSGSQVIANWIWNYFFSEASCASANNHVLVTHKTPLYFQHDGHSRTVVGIQKQKGSLGAPDKYTLLVFDPSQRTAALERTLRENCGWQKFIKRGVHTLNKPQYQICYVEPGIVRGEELEKLKTINSVLLKM